MHPTVAVARILVVEDSPDVISLLERVLGEAGYDVLSATDGESAVARALHEAPDLVILDLGLPGRDGLEVAEELRRCGSSAPVLMLTARDRVSDRVSGFRAGADDYLAKPFDAEELVARVRALLRRSVLRTRAERLHVGDLTLDPVTREVWRGARRIALTQREFGLLEYLMRNTARPLSRAAIAAHVWKQKLGDADTTNIVDVYVAYLRKKLEVGDEPSMLHTVRGVGYVLRAATPD
jgi:two-component system response regulator MprA